MHLDTHTLTDMCGSGPTDIKINNDDLHTVDENTCRNRLVSCGSATRAYETWPLASCSKRS